MLPTFARNARCRASVRQTVSAEDDPGRPVLAHATINSGLHTPSREPEPSNLILERKFNSRVAVAIIVACGSFTGWSTIRGLTGVTAPEPQSSTGTYGEVAPLRAIGSTADAGNNAIIDRGCGPGRPMDMRYIPADVRLLRDN